MPNYTLHKNVYVEKIRPVVKQIIMWQANLTVPICMRVYRAPFLWVKLPGCRVDHPPPFGAEVKERVFLYLYPSLGLHGLFRVNFILYGFE